MNTLFMIVIFTVSGGTAVAPEGIGGSQYLAALIGVVLPILVALVTKYTTRPIVKSLLLLVLSTVTGFLTEMLNDAAFNFEQALFGTVLTFVTGVATLFGLWMPTGVDAKAKATLVHD